jgi:hypothetical protein
MIVCSGVDRPPKVPKCVGGWGPVVKRASEPYGILQFAVGYFRPDSVHLTEGSIPDSCFESSK